MKELLFRGASFAVIDKVRRCRSVVDDASLLSRPPVCLHLCGVEELLVTGSYVFVWLQWAC